MRKHALAMLMLAAAVPLAPTWGDMVVERWGAGQQARHGDAASFAAPAGGGVVVKFELSALPKGAKIYRAILLPNVKAGGFPLPQPIVVQALTKPGQEGDPPALEEQAIPLMPPRYMSFDVTDVVRRWASGKLENHGLRIAGATVNRPRTFLEIAYEGQLKDPPPAVTGLKAFHRAGQTFLTWKEINSKFADQKEVAWKDYRDEVQRIRDGRGEITTYRVYRHTKPITAANLAEAELLDEVGQCSCFDERMVQTEWKGEQIKNVKVDTARVPCTAVEPKTELAPGTGVYVKTTAKAGEYYYAVAAAVDGVENTTKLDEGCATRQPIREEPASPEPILHHELQMQYQKERTLFCYVWWVEPPLSHLPNFIHVGVSTGPKVANPAPLLINGYWWSGGWNGVHPCPQEDGVMLCLDDHPWQTRGVHEGNGTLKAWSQGKVQNFYVRQIKALLPWVQAKYNADMERVYAFSGGWAWRYPEIFAATFEVLSMNPKRSPAMPEVKLYWNDPRNASQSEWGVSPYEYWNTGQWIKDHPAEELAFMSYTPYQHLGDFGRIDKPAFFAAMRDTRHAFACTFEEGRGWYGTADADWIFRIRKSDSIAAFTNCTLDDNPGIGAGWDPGGQINLWLAFDARGQVDQPDKWEMTVYLYAGGRNQSGAPMDSCTADVTPRRCQKFKAKAGDQFKWTNTSLADNKVIQTGTAKADANGLVTLEGVTITKTKNRLVVTK